MRLQVKTIVAALATALALAALASPAAAADFGLTELEVSSIAENGAPEVQAGAHPFALVTNLRSVTEERPPGSGEIYPVQEAKDIRISFPPGLVGKPTAAPRCTIVQFLASGEKTDCPDASAVGFAEITYGGGEGEPHTAPAALYNLTPPFGSVARLGFVVENLAPVMLNVRVNPEPPHNVIATASNISQEVFFIAARTTVWGVPASPAHDAQRGNCLKEGGTCPAAGPEVPFLSLPTNCAEPLSFGFEADSWQNPSPPGAPYPFQATATVQDESEPPNALSPSGCANLKFEPTLEARPTTNVADAPSGLHVDLHVPQPDEATEPGALRQADLRQTLVTLPPGLVINPSAANGLGSCSEAQIGYLGKHEAGTPAGCPESAKIGSAEVNTPLLDHPLKGSVYVATPYANPFGTLLALYVAIEDPATGIVVNIPGEVRADPATGQLRAAFSETPQLPFEDFKLEFNQGPYAPLRTPAVCREYATDSTMTPWSAPEGSAVASSDRWAISAAPGGGGCPSSQSALPNSPQFEAGAATPISATFTPLVVRLRRGDDSQEFSQLTVTPPPGLLARLAGVPYCPEAAIAAAAAKSGAQEQASPSCPAASHVGGVNIAAGAGPSPYWVHGEVYLAGPYKGAPLSLAVITPAVAGPFDLGTVVVRVALHVDPETARITAVSDRIPSILAGIPLDVRNVNMSIDRPSFTLTGTSCDPSSFAGQLVSTQGDSAALADHYQLAECSRLAFKPKLGLRLFGQTHRRAHPKLRAVLRMPTSGQANIAGAVVALPHSEFLDQGHIRTICTRVQFAAEACPKGSVYGYAKAWSPLLDQPLQGPVYLRSSNHPLPDLVAALDGQIEIDLVGRIDSIHGGIRTSFESVPDAPVSKFVLNMQGGGKGLLINSTDICRGKHAANATFTAQNGKTQQLHPAVKDGRCHGRRGGGHHGGGHHRRPGARR
jgi:hypothetical protein